jgi:hypothetical protein
VDEAAVLVIFPHILDQQRVYSAVDVNELPYLVEHWLIEGYAQNDGIEDSQRLLGNHEDGRVGLGQGNRCLRVEVVLEDGVLLVHSLSEDVPEYLGCSLELKHVLQLVPQDDSHDVVINRRILQVKDLPTQMEGSRLKHLQHWVYLEGVH